MTLFSHIKIGGVRGREFKPTECILLLTNKKKVLRNDYSKLWNPIANTYKL